MSLLPVYPRLPITLVRASGSQLWTDDGRCILDLYGGHAVTPLGHGHPDLRAALTEAYGRLDFYSNSLILPEQERAADAVLGASAHLSWVHFVNSGTEANEAALHLARAITGREVVVSFDCSFHGRTLASLGVTGLGGYRKRLTLPMDEWHRALPFGDSTELGAAITEDTAAVICESVPSIAGVRMPPPGFYEALEARCRQVGAMLIFDEVQGGVGRLGTWFAHERFGVQPDLVTLAKSLGGGFPVGAVVGTPAIAEAVEYGEIGTTFGGGPMACAMVETTARVIRRDGLMARTGVIFERIKAGAEALGATVSGAGCLIGLSTKGPASALRMALLERRMLTGSSGDPHTLRLLPPYILSDDEIDEFLAALADAMRAVG